MAAQLPTTIATTIAMTIVVPASCSVAGNARSTMVVALSPVRSDSPK